VAAGSYHDAVLVGRRPELKELHGVTERARSGVGASLVIRGEPGVGKTVLLDELETLAHDFCVIRTDGIESELQLDYAGLHRIVLPFMERLPQLPARQGEAIRAAFGLSATGRPDRFLVGLATLTLLSDPGRTAPLLVVVDDAHWLDQDSMAALAFVGRRLQADRVALVFAVRDSFADQGLTKGLPELHVKGLADDPARELLASFASMPIQDGVATKVVAATAGNPLALIGLAEELTEAQLAGLVPLPDPLPTGELIEARFARQVQLLPKETQTALLLAAADPTHDIASFRMAATELSTSLAALAPAEALKLITTENGIEFRHPLVRSAVYSSASPAHRRDAHLALAGAIDRSSDPEQWAMHRALAALGPEEGVAAALEESAILARARGGYTAETALLTRSAQLSPSTRDSSRRLLCAAQAANLAGNATHAHTLLEAARHGELDEFERAEAQLLDGMIRFPLGQGRRAPLLLLEAAKSFAPLNPELSRRALLSSFSAFLSAFQCADGTTGAEIGHMALSALEGVASESTVDSLLRGLASAFVCHYGEAASTLRRALATFEQMSVEEMTEWNHIATFIANTLWDPDACRVVVDLLEAAARRQGSILALQPALLASAAEAVRQGRFSAARARYAEVVDITEAVGGFTYIYGLLDVELVAWEGEEDAARAKIRDLIKIATAVGSGAAIVHCHYAMAVLELGLGRYPEALTSAQTLEAAGVPLWLPFCLPQIVEAAMRCADIETATGALEQIEERAGVVQTPSALGLMWRCRALVRDDDQTESSFSSSIECLGMSPWRSELARTHLLYGEWLRRKKRRMDARVELRKAYDMFDLMGARAFAERARVELAATGERARTRRVESASNLTVRELQITRLAADGLTNGEIASQLFISPHTVEYHLRKVFQKLGVRSRVQLAKALPVTSEMGE
jgi:DNA-binding CsgD family transcriptional regulator